MSSWWLQSFQPQRRACNYYRLLCLMNLFHVNRFLKVLLISLSVILSHKLCFSPIVLNFFYAVCCLKRNGRTRTVGSMWLRENKTSKMEVTMMKLQLFKIFSILKRKTDNIMLREITVITSKHMDQFFGKTVVESL